MSKVGGYRASLQPIWQLFTPLFVIGFLIQLSTIISDNYKKKYNDELAKGIEKYSNHLDMYNLPENVKNCKTKIQKKEAIESAELREAFDFIVKEIQKKHKKDEPAYKTAKPDDKEASMSYQQADDKSLLQKESILSMPGSLEMSTINNDDPVIK